MTHCGLAKKVTMMLMIIIMINKLYIFNNDFLHQIHKVTSKKLYRFIISVCFFKILSLCRSLFCTFKLRVLNTPRNIIISVIYSQINVLVFIVIISVLWSLRPHTQNSFVDSRNFQRKIFSFKLVSLHCHFFFILY